MTNDNMHVLVLSSVWLEPDSSAAGRHMMQLISLFQAEGWPVTYASTAVTNEYMVNLQKRGIHQVTVNINDPGFDDFIHNLQPSVVLFNRFTVEEAFGWRVAEQCPDTLRVLDTEDLHCLRKARGKAMQENRLFVNEDLLSAKLALREVAAILRSDLSLIISEVEMLLLSEIFGVDDSLLHYLPFMLDPVNANVMSHWPDFKSRSHFVTIGNFRHSPNWDAVQYLKTKIWPLIIKELPAAQLHIYGAYPSREVYDLHRPKEGFHIKGRADDARKAVRNARVCLAPLRFGAGLKGKLVEAMECGTPSVTTPVGAEGISGGMEWSGFIVNDAVEIASAAVKLYTDSALWKRSQENGVRIINSRFTQKIFCTDLINRITSVTRHIQKHRQKNFTGRMLWHHSMTSTKYMSRWIEEKNKR